MQKEKNSSVGVDIDNEYLAQHKQKSKLLNEKILSGKISLNEARKEFGLPPTEGGDVLITKV